ncbi:hypothetical protein D3C78_1731840 [compost metagenome]
MSEHLYLGWTHTPENPVRTHYILKVHLQKSPVRYASYYNSLFAPQVPARSPSVLALNWLQNRTPEVFRFRWCNFRWPRHLSDLPAFVHPSALGLTFDLLFQDRS